MTEDVDDNPSGVDLADAIDALREQLTLAASSGEGRSMRFRIAPVELTLQATLMKTAKGTGGIKWHILTVGGERARQAGVQQTIKVTLIPELHGPDGPLEDSEPLISGADSE